MQIYDKTFTELIRECKCVVDALSCRCEPYWTELLNKHEPNCNEHEVADLRDIIAGISKDLEMNNAL